MTEQPAEPPTEQTWLGNPATFVPTPAAYLHDGHRIPVRPVVGTAPKDMTGLAAKFLGAVDAAFDKADNDLQARRATDPGLHRIHEDIEAARRATDPGLRRFDADIEPARAGLRSILADIEPARLATDPGLRRLDADIEAARAEKQRTSLDLNAEIHAGNAVEAFSNGELDAGIAWLQSALAFAQNHRHTTRHEGTNQ